MLTFPFHAQAERLTTDTALSDTLQVTLEDVRIEAARLTETSAQAPFAVTTFRISEERRLSAPGLVLTEPLRGIPGLWVNDRNNFAVGERISIRGMGWRAAFGVRGIHILMDGVPLTMPDGQSIMTLIDPSFIKDVEVVRGPVSSFWGNAGGGALLMSTANFSPEPHVRARVSAGSFGYSKQDVEAGFNVGGNRYQIYGSRLWQDGFRDHSRFEAWRFGGHADITLDERSRLRLTAAVLESPASDNPGALTATEAAETPDLAAPNNLAQNARKITRHGQFGARYRLLLDQGDLEVQTWGLARKLQNPLAFAWIQVDRLAGGLRSTLQQEYQDFSFGVGFDAAIQSDSRRNWVNEARNGGDQGPLTLDQQEDVYSLAAFSRVKIPFGNFAFSAGLRADWFDFRNSARFRQGGEDTSGSRSFGALSPMAGISYQSGDWFTYLNFTTGFETPTTTELVNRPDMTGGFNPDLRPERTIGLELGTRSTLSQLNLTLDAAVFTMYVDDVLQQFVGENDRSYFRNVGATRHNGFELFAEWMPVRMFTLQAGYSFSDLTFDSDELVQAGEGLKGNQLPGIPKHRISGYAEVRPGALQLRLEGDYSASYYVNSINSAKNDAYAVFNLNASWISLPVGDHTRITPFLQINNIFDERYNGSVIINGFGGRFYEPSPGRNWQAGINVRFS
ncbi:MAG: TonB-dependent receptor [Candidatus Cyclonatronum sp.]|uniref:TonB-dependent receptor family protein n=1 Tax=Cyclonatronum sp. TaxID=3024185 RepID=UPI0025BA4A6E|nr:TonB-dependent receptor [Cyclonatronum sp.]MCH8487670.1 TonB-dependent receptor [Cyclonatronum sp.]